MPFTLTGSDVKRLRESVGVTQADLARHLGYTKSAVCNWERRPAHSIPRTQYQAVLDYLVSRRESIEAQRAQAARVRSVYQA